MGVSMNSQEEKELLESYGWEYNYIRRCWVAPDGVTLDIDDLVFASVEYREAAEIRLRQIAARHGKKVEP